GLGRVRWEAERRRPALVIVDPLLRFVRLRAAGDDAAVTTALEPLLALARDTGAHVLAAHHLGKAERSGGDGILGSTAIFAAVDTALLLTRNDQDVRTLSSIQRYGPDLEPVTLVLDPDTRTLSAGPPPAELEEARLGQAILAAVAGRGEAEEREIHVAVPGRKALKVRALRRLVAHGRLVRRGRGRRGDAYRYAVSGSPVSTCTRELACDRALVTPN
ncbi:MAG: AAA family ATPase, partial [Candidatus Rokubacteria bacterium]|nr:AAA family ATPase [Candidatus Rokubacteria bacterium]